MLEYLFTSRGVERLRLAFDSNQPARTVYVPVRGLKATGAVFDKSSPHSNTLYCIDDAAIYACDLDSGISDSLYVLSDVLFN